jgi:hypothetical protein
MYVRWFDFDFLNTQDSEMFFFVFGYVCNFMYHDEIFHKGVVVINNDTFYWGRR